jgi:hypothetical protein
MELLTEVYGYRQGDMDMDMVFYRGNRVDGEFTAEVADVAEQFWASPQAQVLLDPEHEAPLLERVLRRWLTDPAGLNSTWTDEVMFGQLWGEVRSTWPQQKEVQ